jgi:hypothetical protein
MGGDKVFQLVLQRLVQDAMPALSPTGDESPLSAAAAIEAQWLLVFSNSGMSLERPGFGGARSANRL